MKYMSLLFIFVILLGCNKDTPSEVQILKLNEPFELRIGQSAIINYGELSFKFDSVPYDYRCPEDALCIWAGYAAVVLRFPNSTDTLYSEIAYERFEIKLISLSPYPKNLPIPQDTYVATLVVTKN